MVPSKEPHPIARVRQFRSDLARHLSRFTGTLSVAQMVGVCLESPSSARRTLRRDSGGEVDRGERGRRLERERAQDAPLSSGRFAGFLDDPGAAAEPASGEALDLAA